MNKSINNSKLIIITNIKKREKKIAFLFFLVIILIKNRLKTKKQYLYAYIIYI